MNPSGKGLTDAERLDWLRLIRSENVGPRTFQGLMSRFGSAGAVLSALPDLARRSTGARAIKVCPVADAEREWEQAIKRGIRFLALPDADYPPALRAIDSPPPLIAVRGHGATLLRPIVAVVGSRNASVSGLVFTERLVRPLAAAGCVVASGLARGIDAKAHVASLESGTVAVLAGGQDRIYPSEHEALAMRILENGALISEMPLGWEPRARDFPRRNRIVAGLSLGVVVVEASRRSGSLITARFANEQGREVFAVPGSPLDPRAEGTNGLLRQGATICISGEDVLTALRPVMEAGVPRSARVETSAEEAGGEALWEEADLFGETATAHSGPRPPPGDDRQGGDEDETSRPDAPSTPAARLLALIGPTPVLVDELVRASGMAPRHLQAALVELEIQGRVCRPDGYRVAAVVDVAGA